MQPSYRWAAGPSGKVTVAPDFRAASLPAKLPKELPPTPPRTTGASNCRSPWSGPPAPTARPMSPKTLLQHQGKRLSTGAGKQERSKNRLLGTPIINTIALRLRSIHVPHGFIPDGISDSASSLAPYDVIRFKVNTAITPRCSCLICSFRKGGPGKSYRLSRSNTRFNRR